MEYWQAVLLGIVQGLTEFLPVSSSGHLVIGQWQMGFDPDDPAMILFDLVVHLGTVLAVLVYYRRSLKSYLGGLAQCGPDLLNPVTSYQKNPVFRVTLLALAATVATGVIYVLFHDSIESGFNSPPMVAVCWIVTATVLLITDRRGRVRGSLREFSLIAALAVGLAQGVALFPGISRSGSTICVAVLFGLRRPWAGQFSFLIGVPAICGATLIKFAQYFQAGHVSVDWGPMIVGGLISAVVGLAALALLLWAVRRAKLKFFAIYCYLLAIGTLIVYTLQSGNGTG